MRGNGLETTRRKGVSDMICDINRIILSGRLVRDPEYFTAKYTGKKLCTFKIACNRRKRKDEDEPECDIVKCVVWGKGGEIIEKYFSQGDEIFVMGRLASNVTKATNGKYYENTAVFVEDFLFGQKPEANRIKLREKLGEKGSTTSSSDDLPPLPTEEDMYAAIGEIGDEELPF